MTIYLFVRNLLIVALALLMTACGGGGGGGSNSSSTQPLTSVAMIAWIGAQNTEVDLPSVANGAEFYRSSTADCNLANYANCADGQLTILNGLQVTDTAATLARPGYYTLKRSAQLARLTISADQVSNPIFAGRLYHQVAVFNGRLFLVGGFLDNNTPDRAKNDVWSSSDGVNWKLETEHAEFSVRYGHQLAVFRDRLWLIGGRSNGTDLNDVWSSADGAHWRLEVQHAAFAERTYHQVAVLNGELWLLGGYVSTGPQDAWSSTDGITWVQRSFNVATDRFWHTMIAYNNQLWVIGGYALEDKNDVWSSSDGVNWTQRTAHAAFSRRVRHQVVVHQNKIWLIGGGNGGDGGFLNDVWTSSDGSSWTQIAASGDFPARFGHQAVSYENRLLVIGGASINKWQNDTWASADGNVWRFGFSGIFQFQ